MLSQGSTKLDKLSQSSMGHTLDKREATDPRGKESSTIIRRDPGSRVEGMLGQGNNPDSRQPMLQETMIQA